MKIKYFTVPLVILTIFFLLNLKHKNYSDFLKAEFKTINKFDKPDISGFRDFLMTQDPKLNRVPTERLAKAFELKQMLSANKNSNSLNWAETQSNMGGRTRDIMYDPTDLTHKKVWVCSVTGGLWYNTDITNPTSNWISVSDNWITLSTTNICYDPNNTSTFYVGTGEAETAVHTYRESSGRGFGIWKTTDAGQTWTQLPSTQNFAYISDIEVRNENGTSVIYAGVLSGEYKGSIFQSTPTDGLYRSSDGGNTWVQVLPNIDGETEPFAPSDIEITENGTIYVGTTNNLNGAGGACILKSTTGLNGSWSVNSDYKNALIIDSEYNIPGRVEISASKSNPTTIYAIIGAASTTELIEGFGTSEAKYIVKTTNNGANWNYVNMPLDDGNGRNWAYLSWHAFSIQVDPNNENNVFIGGLDIHKSADGGNSWNKISDWVLMYYGGGNEYVHADIHKIAFNPTVANAFVVTTDGGVFYTNNSDNSAPIFQQRNNSYNTLQFYSCAIPYLTGDQRYTGGLQDNGTIMFQNHNYEINDMLQGGDGAFTMWDQNEEAVITSTYDNSMIMFYDGGYTQINDYTCGTFITPFDYDYEDNIIYSNAITFNNDFPDQIYKISGLPYSQTPEFINVSTGTTTPFSAVRFTKTNTNEPILLLGNYIGNIYKISNINSSPSSTEISNGQLPNNAYISCIQTSKNADTILLTFSNYGVQSVWQTYNGGNLWNNISGNLPDMPIRWAIYHPQNKHQIMLATETGIWQTTNASATTVTWDAQNTTFPNVRVDMVNVKPSDNFVVAATHGRGMFTSTWDLASNIENLSNKTETQKLNIYPNPCETILNINNSSNETISEIEIYSINGKLIYKNTKVNDTHSQINVENLELGKYIIVATNKSQKRNVSFFVKKWFRKYRINDVYIFYK